MTWQITLASSFSKWEDPIIKGVAEGGLAIVSLGFAAFTFLYGSLLAIKDSGIATLKIKLRRALYATAGAVLLATVLSIIAFLSIGLQSPVLADIAIAVAVFVLLILSGITVYLAFDVYRGGKKP
jgi:hypothetical protein